MRHLLTVTACALAMSAGSALAQEAQSTPAPEAADSAATTAISDDELLRFGRAVVAIQEIGAAPEGTYTEETRQAALAAAVEAEGLDVATFNRVGQAVSADPAQQQRLVGLLQADQAAAAGGQ